MAFNSLMIRLAAETLAHAAPSPSLIELGNQTFKPKGNILEEVKSYLGKQKWPWNSPDFDRLNGLKGAARESASAGFCTAIGYSSYACIDVNDRYGALQMDLNESLAGKYGFHEQYDVVTNNGTGEHVFDQASVFRNMHALAKSDGIFLHVLPFHNYTNHGFYNFQPVLFYDLAHANGYELLRLSVANSSGDEIAFAEERPESTTRKVSFFPLDEAINRTTAWPGVRDLNPSHIKRSRRSLGSAMRRLTAKKANVLVVALMRKKDDQPFRFPIQGMYSGANISGKEIAAAYRAGSG
jgi:SAM-dependent methyltransferase